MSYTGTAKSNMIIPEVMAAIVEAEFLYNIKVSKFAKIYNELKGKPGDTIVFPYFEQLNGDAVELSEATRMSTNKIGQNKWNFSTVKEIGKAVEISDTALLTGLGDWKKEAGRQLGLAIARKVDKDVIAEAATTTTVVDVSGGATANKLSYDVVIEAISKFGEYYDEAEVLIIHSQQAKTLVKDPSFIDMTKYGEPVMKGGFKAIGQIAGIPVIISDTLPVDTVNGKYTAFLFQRDPVGIAYKRDILIETDRDILARTTVITATIHYAVKLLPDLRGLPKVVKIITKA